MDEDFLARFANHFHNLTGETVGEKRKSLFQLFNHSTILKTNPSVLDAVTAELQPSTHLENRFFVEFLIHFRRYNELMHEFVKENELVVGKIIKQRWFWEWFSENDIKRIVPNLSHSLTLKVLKSLVPVLSEERANEIFDYLHGNYGIFVASIIITCCSTEKIKNVLLNNFPILKLDQLQRLFDNNPDLIYIYLQEKEKLDGNRLLDSHPLFKYIAQKNITVFMDLCQKYDFKVKLGRKITKRIVTTKRAEILSNPKLYVKNLHASCLIIHLGSDFPKLFLQLFPRKIEDSPNAESSRLLKSYPKSKRYELLVNTFNQIFAKKLEESPNLIDEYILEMIPDPNERERMAKIKNDDPETLKYYSLETCFQKIKEKINFARTPYERSLHVATLTECCIVNHDFDGLLKVAKFVNERYANDGEQVIVKFLQTLIWRKTDFNKLNEDHWKEIWKISARIELGTSYDHTNMEVFCKYIEYLLELGKPLREELRKCFKKKDLELYHFTFFQKKYQSRVLSELLELVPEITSGTNTIEVLDCMLLSVCLEHNSKNRKDLVDISEYPRLAQSVKSALTNRIKKCDLAPALQILVCSKQRTKDIEDLRSLVWDYLEFATPATMKWFVNHRPRLIEKHLTKFLTYTLSQPELVKDVKIWHTLKCYKIDIKKTQFSSKLTPPKCLVLSHLMPNDDFFKLVESQKKPQLDVQTALLRGLRNVNSPIRSLSVVLKYCTIDSAFFCLGPLFSLAYKIPREDFPNCVVEMKKRNIPWLTKFVYDALATVGTTKDVVSGLVESQITSCLKISFTYFLKNPSEESWGLFRNKLSSVQIDPGTSRVLASKTVPTKYKARHFENVWTIFHKTNNKNINNLLNNVQKETLLELKPEFLLVAIGTTLFYQPEMNKVASIFLTTCKIGRRNILSTSLQNYKASPLFSIKQLNEFVMTLFTTYMETEENDELLVELLLEVFQMFPTAQIFEEHIIISFMKFKNKSIGDFSQAVIDFYNGTVGRFGETIVEIFAHILKKLLPYFCKNEEMYELFYLLLNYKKSAVDALLVVHLLPNGGDPEDAVSFGYYKRILGQLRNLDMSLQLFLNLYFQNRKVVSDVSFYQKVGGMCIGTSSWLCPGARKRIGCYFY